MSENLTWHNPALRRNPLDYDPCEISAVYVQVDSGNMNSSVLLSPWKKNENDEWEHNLSLSQHKFTSFNFLININNLILWTHCMYNK